MTNRGPIDFLAAIVVEFGGLALLLAALPLLGGSRSAEVTNPPRPGADGVELPWPRNENPTPWDDQAASLRALPDDRTYVEQRLVQRGEKLLGRLIEQAETVLSDRQTALSRPPNAANSQ